MFLVSSLQLSLHNSLKSVIELKMKMKLGQRRQRCSNYIPERMYNLRRGSQFVQPNVNTTTFGLNTLRYEGARIWNMIPEHIKVANDVHHFKSMMNLWSGPECHCGNCILCYIYRLWWLSCICMLLAFYLPFIGLYYAYMVFSCFMLHCIFVYHHHCSPVYFHHPHFII